MQNPHKSKIVQFLQNALHPLGNVVMSLYVYRYTQI